MQVWRGTEPGARLLIAASFLSSIPTGFLVVALPIYLNHIGLHPELIGTLFTVSGIASAVLLVVFGILADRYGRKPFVLLGAIFPVLSYLILAFSTSRPLLLLASAIGGVGLAGGMSGALMNAGFNALLSEKSGPENRTKIFTLAEMAWVMAALIGSLLAGMPEWLRNHFKQTYHGSYHLAFLVMVGLGLAAALVLLPLKEQHSVRTARDQWLPRVSGKRIALLSCALGSLGLGLGFIVQLLPLWFHLRYHVTESFLGPWYGISQFVALGGLFLATPLSRKWGSVPFVILVQSLASGLLVLLAFSPTISIAVALWIGRQIMMNASWPVQQAYIMDVVHPSERATASSLTYGAWSIGSALTPPIGGAFLGAHLYTVPFLLGSVCYAVSIGIFYVFFRRIGPRIAVEEHSHHGIPAAGA